MKNNKLISIDEDMLVNLRKDANEVIKKLDLNPEDSKISYKFTISGDNLIIKIENDFTNLVKDRSAKERDNDYHFIKSLEYDFCFINADILKVSLEDCNYVNTGEEDLTSFIKSGKYKEGYKKILDINSDIGKFVLILTLQR